MLLALVSTESFLTLQLNESGFDKESLAQAMSSIRNEERLSIMDKMQCVLFAWLHANMPPLQLSFSRRKNIWNHIYERLSKNA
jgi:hypothetical protein